MELTVPVALGAPRALTAGAPTRLAAPAARAAPHRGGVGLGVALAPLALAAFERSRRPQVGRRYTAEFTRVIGDWADGLVEAGEIELVTSELDGITQFRGVHSKDRSRYGEEYDLKAGSTENLYLIKARERPWVLVGAFERQGLVPKLMAMEQGLKDKLGRLVLQFFDGKQVPFLEELALQCKLEVYCSMPTVLALKKSLSDEVLERVSFVPIKNSSRMEIEEGRVMRFVLTPTKKLPESMSAFDPQTGTLFTGKFFSAHRSIGRYDSAVDSKGVEGWEEYVEDWYHLFDCYFFTQRAAVAVRKLFMLCEALRGPDVAQLAPLHGPVVREQCWKLMAKYEAWTEQKLRKETRREFEVLVMYASAYGHTKTLAESISRGLAQSGVKVVDMNLEHCGAEDVERALATADGFCIGSPTLGGEMPSQVKEALGVVLNLPADKHMPCGVFGSFGWSGEAVDELQFRLKDSGFPLAFDPVRAKFRPTEEVLDLCNASGVRLFQKLCRDVLQRRKRLSRNVAQVKAKPGDGALEAFGKMRTSQAVMSFLEEGKDVTTPVSWVNQASFEPLGLTLAIPKPQREEPVASLDVETSLDELLKNHESRRSRYLEGEEIKDLIVQLLGTDDKRLAEAQELLDPYEENLVTFDELRLAVQPGEPFRQLLDGEKAEEKENSENPLEVFTLSLVPEGQSNVELAKGKAHKKAKPSNGCMVMEGCHAFLECKTTSVLDAGDHKLIYAEVQSGKVLDESQKTDLISVLNANALGDLKRKAPALAAGRVAASGKGFGAFAGASRAHAAALAWARPRRLGVARRARGGELQMSEIESWTGLTPGKEYRLQTMSIEEVAKDTSTIRSLDWDRDRFDIEFRLERGTTYNSYIIRGSEKCALVDTSHEKFEHLYLAALRKELDLGQLDYLIVSHTEPDHSGLIGKVLELAEEAGNKDLEIIGSKMCISYLQNLVFRPFKSRIVQTGVQIDLGGGHNLEFVIAPNLHWPDTMFTYDHKTGMLFTCDAFGMHYCSENALDVEGVKELTPHYSLYYDCLMKPNARSVLSALGRIKDLEVKTIATGHGPILSEFTSDFMELYRSWSEKATAKIGPSVAIFWVSRFGESERLSQLFAHGLTSCNVNVEMHDLNAVDAFEITECLARNEIIAVMAPPAESSAAQKLGSIVTNVKPKKHQFIVLDSCDDAQEPVALLRGRLLEADVPEALPAVEVKKPVTVQILHTFEEAGMQLGKKLTLKSKTKAAKGADKDLSKALGRVASSLYVVTAKKANVRHAMVASWVTPASAKPLGVSVTIAKERAMEPLLRIGDSFTLNLLEDGKPATLQMMKHFLQRFAPGEDRLRNVDHVEGANGAAILRSACAYLECRIVSRMDAGDHWVGYAEVVGGSVASPNANTAVHHRKVGTYY
ncbi:unnamed protein product [Effrenium voratum]|uniref:Flavodoxin-like domain-containing protein n=1 Tax=Effrenium voratum TaxID=2562239 RepID=A0AA36MT12_9DINO|nr:unnamed protein product [Effrenium voratum]